MNAAETLRCQSMKRIELIVWSGSVELLAFWLGIRPDDLLAALGRVQDLRAVPIRLDEQRAGLVGGSAATGGGRLCATLDVY